jgi:hypothetical protein
MPEPKVFDDPQPFDSPEAIVAMHRRQAELGKLAQKVAFHGLRELEAKMEQNVPLNMTAGEAMDLLSVGIRMERDAKQSEEGQSSHKPEPPKKVN